MGVEIERKFLVKDTTCISLANNIIHIRQGYICADSNNTVRVRLVNDEKAIITVKGKRNGMSRPEYEYNIPMLDGIGILSVCKYTIDKIRYLVKHNDLPISVDVFAGSNAGLVIAEVEFTDTTIAQNTKLLPDWIGEEVTDNGLYYNLNIAQYPFLEWVAT